MYICINKNQHKSNPAVKLLKHRTSEYSGNCCVLIPNPSRSQSKVMYSSQLSLFICESGHHPADSSGVKTLKRTHWYKMKHTQSDSTLSVASQCGIDNPAAWNVKCPITKATLLR